MQYGVIDIQLSLSGSLRSAASVLISRDMGFGLGPANLDYLKFKRSL